MPTEDGVQKKVNKTQKVQAYSASSNKKSFIATVIFGVLFLFAIAYSTISFTRTVNFELEKSVRGTLTDMANQQQLSLDRQLESMLFSLSSVSETLPIIAGNFFAEEIILEMSNMPNAQQEILSLQDDILEYINEKKTVLNLDAVAVIGTDGMALLDNGGVADLSDTEYFRAAMTGQPYVTESHPSDYVDKNVFTVAVPIFVEGEIDGVLAVEYCTDYMAELLTTFTDVRGLNLIVNQDSEIILSTNEFVVSFDAFKQAEFEGGETFESVTDDFRNRRSGSISYTLNGERKFGEYRPMNISDWMLFFEISEESLVQSVQNISNSMLLTSVLIILFGFIVVVYIVVSKNKSAKVLEQAAYYDELTGIPNLLRFKMLVAESIAKNPNTKYVMVKMDLVNFKAINEMFGYDMGDKVICAIANVGKNVQDKFFIQARTSADEFMFFSEGELFEHLDKSSKDYEARFKTYVPELEEHTFSFRYGRYYLHEGETDVNNIVNKTNIAHSFAKGDGSGSNIWDYDEQFTKKVLRDAEIANKMHKALQSKEFKVYLQAKYDIAKEKIEGAEALVRWVQNDGSMIFPNEFIPLFEQNGFIVELDKYMLRGVCETLKRRNDMGEACIPVSVNFSRLHLRNRNFVSELADIVASYGVSPEYIEVELTESTVMENEKELVVLLDSLHKAGFLVSIDDFGSGYSSLGMLKNFRVDTLKLDRSFFVELNEEESHGRGDIVVSSVVKLAGELGMHTVAEGIEEKYQVEFLRKIGCDAAQGYYFAKPMPAADFEKLLLEEG